VWGFIIGNEIDSQWVWGNAGDMPIEQYMEQYGVVEFHSWGSRIDQPEQPDQLIFDLDPADDVPWEETLGAAFLVRDMLEDIDLPSFAKTTGGKGLHVCVPLRRKADWDEAKAFCKQFTKAIVRKNPERFISKATKNARRGKIFVDYLRNGYGATAVAPFSVRARPGLPIAVPIRWKELQPSLRPDQWNLANIDKRLKDVGAEAWSDWEHRRSLTGKRLTAFTR